MEREKEIYMLVSLWTSDNPEPKINERLTREYVKDFVSSGFQVAELDEAIRRYRRDHLYPKRNFAMLWDLCVRIRAARLDVASALEAWPVFWQVLGIIRRGHSDLGTDKVPIYELTTEMIEAVYSKPSRATAERLFAIVKSIGFGGLDTGNESADRARFVQIYEIMDHRITQDSVWFTPDNLLPAKKQAPQLGAPEAAGNDAMLEDVTRGN